MGAEKRLGGLNDEEEDKEKLLQAVKDLFDRGKGHAAAKLLLLELKTIEAWYGGGMKQKTFRETLEYRGKVSPQLIEARGHLEEINLAYDAIYNYGLVVDAMKREKEVEGDLLKLVGKKLDSKTGKAIDLITKDYRDDNEAKEALLGSKCRAEEYLEAWRKDPRKMEKLQAMIEQILKHEL